MAGKKFPAFPAHAQPAILRIWQEAHGFVVGGVFHSVWTYLSHVVLSLCWLKVTANEKYFPCSICISVTHGRDGVSNHQPHHCLLNRLFRRRSKKTPKLRVTDVCEENSPVTDEFLSQRASNAENASIWWCHHVCMGWIYDNTTVVMDTLLNVLWFELDYIPL